MRLSSTVVRLTLLSLLLALALLALAHGTARIRSQEATTATPEGGLSAPDTLVIPASDSLALAHALSAAAFRAPGHALHLYLAGGTYAFAEPGSAEAHGLPPISTTVVLHGNAATIRLGTSGGEARAARFLITETGELTLKHVTLLAGEGRAIVNEGTLRLADSRLANDQGAPAYYLPDGGGIENRGVLDATRTTFERNRLLARSAPGGAIWNAGHLTVTCTRFVENVASVGGRSTMLRKGLLKSHAVCLTATAGGAARRSWTASMQASIPSVTA